MQQVNSDLRKAQAENEERWKEEIRRNREEQKKREKEQEEKQIQLRKDHEAQIAKMPVSADQKEGIGLASAALGLPLLDNLFSGGGKKQAPDPQIAYVSLYTMT